MLNSLKQIERTGQASFEDEMRLLARGLIEIENSGWIASFSSGKSESHRYYRLTTAGETELARLLLVDRAKKDKRNAAARNRGAALRGVGMKRTADGWV